VAQGALKPTRNRRPSSGYRLRTLVVQRDYDRSPTHNRRVHFKLRRAGRSIGGTARARPVAFPSAQIDAIGPPITLRPDKSGKSLWAEYGLLEPPQLLAVGMPEFKVAGTCNGAIGRPCQFDGCAQNAAESNCLVAGGRYELYSNYALKIQAVAASVAPT
jgi:hypothetical protein